MEAASGKAVWTGRVITIVVSLLFFFSAAMKFVGGAQVKEESMIIPLGILELACAVVFLIPATSVLGAILLAGYMGGAICTHWRAGDLFLPQVGIALLVWLAIYLREPRLKALIPLRRS